MTSISLHPGKTIFDGWLSISISLFMTLVGYGVLVGVPVISAAIIGMLIYLVMYIFMKRAVPELASSS